MQKTVTNGKAFSQRFFGLHFYPGTAEYRERGKEPYRIFINESTIKKIGPSFEGRPVYVKHVNEVPDHVDAVKEDADGVVVRSFFNQHDGKHWAEFMIFSNEGMDAIRRGWSLSNAYLAKAYGEGGSCNGVDYQSEVLDAEYEHLAIVPNPRYEESVIYTPEQFKAYNDKKEQELSRYSNSKGDEPVLKIFKKQKVENSVLADLEGHMVVLENSKQEVSIGKAIELADEYQNMMGYANGEHMVKTDADEMTVNQMVKKFNTMVAEAAKAAEAAESVDEKDDDKKKKNAKDDEEKDDKKDKEEKKENDEEEEDKKDDKKKNEHFESLKNAHLKEGFAPSAPVVESVSTQVARGAARYGAK